MRLPNGNRALVEDDKLRGYVLNPTHPVGRHHAALFEKLLGIRQANREVLREALLDAAENEAVAREVATPYGKKYEMQFPLSGPAGTKTVLAVWMIDHRSDRPRLITCYVE